MLKLKYGGIREVEEMEKEIKNELGKREMATEIKEPPMPDIFPQKRGPGRSKK